MFIIGGDYSFITSILENLNYKLKKMEIKELESMKIKELEIINDRINKIGIISVEDFYSTHNKKIKWKKKKKRILFILWGYNITIISLIILWELF